ncbi:MAG: hypothetical protein JF597_32895 [Streptomyces sp.]|uniref:hypothetical protein n=1 Tax=Streptomyces sp. TaxID=1931 RepID=UPI0025E8D5B7|nr:hypothetical protein [Streptomyces sp.]MBW8798211.1 hypothetical protein [Streptomyces sp.]
MRAWSAMAKASFAFPVAPVGAGGVVDGAAGDVDNLLLAAGQQRDHRGGLAALRSIAQITG